MKQLSGLFLSFVLFATIANSLNHHHEDQTLGEKKCSVCLLASKIKNTTLALFPFSVLAINLEIVSQVEFKYKQMNYKFLYLDFVKARGPPLFV